MTFMLLIISQYRQPPTPGHMCLNLRTQTSCQLTTSASFAPYKQPMPILTDPFRKSYLKLLSSHASEHYPNSSYGVYPSQDDSSIAILLVANKYSPNNFWNGRYRAIYNVPVSSGGTITGTIHVDVHYYEDGNVSLNNKKPVSISITSASPADTAFKRIVTTEREHQEELNDAFNRLSEGAFKGLRRQLPITRQKVEWEKIGAYRLGKDISGGTGY
ncbi:hypothetical protein TRV_04383 [Trichophyton verrucosum HKI 0517]|uniref:F-actin-capping protein subunit alpha n=1 Tax=Trichophyton verrucosum (strain HKI 0517) TaxID=663202 RepID=D4DB84_TRIVH|nr:uncharacterized protein TRV_04383 [Trichophyton verrucosum HKI 0517]EFE40918.1 hypothetical protein TRV_04383 [Trichophyton verrucosum HKI 0517]